MKHELERVGGTGPLQGTALRVVLQAHGGLEVVMLAGDREALDAFATSLGMPLPLPEESILEVLLVEKRLATISLINQKGEGIAVPGSAMTH